MSDNQTKVAFQKKLVSGDTGGKDFCLILEFGNKARREFDLTQLPGYVPGLTDVAKRVFEHGASQMLGDVSARSTRERDYVSALAALDDLWDRMLNGTVRGANRGDLAEALSVAGKISLEDAKALIGIADENQLKVLTSNPEIKAQLAEIKARRAKEQAATAKPEQSLGDILKALKPGVKK